MPADEMEGFIEIAVRSGIESAKPDMATMHADLRKHFGQYKVLCLSERNDSILMWSHYAVNHTGIVIRFSCLEETERQRLTEYCTFRLARPSSVC